MHKDCLKLLYDINCIWLCISWFKSASSNSCLCLPTLTIQVCISWFGLLAVRVCISWFCSVSPNLDLHLPIRIWFSLIEILTQKFRMRFKFGKQNLNGIMIRKRKPETASVSEQTKTEAESVSEQNKTEAGPIQMTQAEYKWLRAEMHDSRFVSDVFLWNWLCFKFLFLKHIMFQLFISETYYVTGFYFWSRFGFRFFFLTQILFQVFISEADSVSSVYVWSRSCFSCKRLWIEHWLGFCRSSKGWE